MNNIDIFLVPHVIRVTHHICSFNIVFTMSITNTDVTERDITGEGGKRLLDDINFRSTYTRSSRAKVLRGLMQ